MLTSYAFPQKSFPSLSEDGFSVELTVVAPEQPSPVSVLDVSFYKDDLPPSPVKKLEDPFIGKVLGSVIIFKFFLFILFYKIGTRTNRNGILSECDSPYARKLFSQIPSLFPYYGGY